MPVDDSVHRGDVPPPVDLAGHIRELSRAFVPAFLIAVLIGAAVFGYRNFVVEKQYAATVVTEIAPAGDLVPGDAFIEQLRAPITGLASDTAVLNAALDGVDTDIDAGTLSSRLTLEPGTSPALLNFTVTAESPELAQQLATSMVTAVGNAAEANYVRDTAGRVGQLQQSIAAEEGRLAALADDDPLRGNVQSQLDSLRSQLTQVELGGADQLVVLSIPETDSSPVSPQPVAEALVAFLAALILAAEAIVLLRGRWGSKPNRAWARRTARKHRAIFEPGAGEGMPPVVAARIAALERSATSSSRPSRHAAKAGTTVQILVLLGDGTAVSTPVPDSVVRADLSSEWWKAVDVTVLDTAVVVLSTRAKNRSVATATLRQLRQFSVSTYLVLQDGKKGDQAGPGQLYSGQQYTGQQYGGYPGQQYPGQQYSGAQYPGQQYPGQQYPGQQYPGRHYPGEQELGQQHLGQQHPSGPLPRQRFADPRFPPYAEPRYSGEDDGEYHDAEVPYAEPRHTEARHTEPRHSGARYREQPSTEQSYSEQSYTEQSNTGQSNTGDTFTEPEFDSDRARTPAPRYAPPQSGAQHNGTPSNGTPGNGAPGNGGPSNGAPSHGMSRHHGVTRRSSTTQRPYTPGSNTSRQNYDSQVQDNAENR